jgi:general secretion pathway protein L
MNQLLEIRDTFSQWIDLVANTIISLAARLRTQRQITLVEDESGGFILRSSDHGREKSLPDHRIEIADGAVNGTIPGDWSEALRGSQTEIVLRPTRLLFRPLELPKRAIEFLEAIIRSQIDRLTPWTAAESIYGWTLPENATGDRIRLTVAATSKALVRPYLDALTDIGVRSAIVSTIHSKDAAAVERIKLFELKADAALNTGRVRLALLGLLLTSGVAALVGTGVSTVIGGSLATEQQDISQRIAQRRVLLRAGRDGAGAPERLLEVRKRETPASVIVLEEISRLLPDNTYVTELRIEGDKLQLVGITQDAPSLVPLIEQSEHFTRATFFAPTTRTANDPGERFHIEVRVKPVFPAGM